MMRKRFTRALFAVSAAAVVAGSVSLGAGAASAATRAEAGTVACGFSCVNFYSAQLGTATTMNAFVPGDTGAGGRVGQKVNMRLAGNFRPNGDFEFAFVSTVGALCGTFFSPTSYVCLHDASFPAFELSWSPFGNQSNLCAGVAVGGVAGENVTLQPCGVSANTVWIEDQNHATNGGFCLTPSKRPVGPGRDPSVNYCPLINGGDTRFAQPLVMTLNTGTSHPANQLVMQPLTLVGPFARTDQLFAHFDGPI